jgi:hypothetical protein
MHQRFSDHKNPILAGCTERIPQELHSRERHDNESSTSAGFFFQRLERVKQLGEHFESFPLAGPAGVGAHHADTGLVLANKSKFGGLDVLP